MLMPFLSTSCGVSHNLQLCSLSNEVLTAMKIMGPIGTVWWLVQTCFILYLNDNSRISKGRYFIRYSFEVEMIILLTITINRIMFNMLNHKVIELKALANFALYLILLLKVKWGNGIVHPLTKKYFTLFCLMPFWFVLSQALLVLTGTVMSSAFLISLVSFGLFLPVYFFKVDEIDLNLVALQRHDTIENPRKLLVKLDTLLVMMREESLGDDKYSILLEGVIREFQEYNTGDETELLNNFTKEEVKDKDNFFKARQNSLLRLISLYYMKGISR